jgi:hypothetical protein
MNWLLKFIPADKRLMIELGMRIVSSLDTAEERKNAVSYGITMLADGKVSIVEWSRFGKLLGLLRGPGRR